ncbi:MAG: Gfo/Idh/MocA family oxidoreductase [Spirochaetes bacterium]|nr:Gfo/Idh/MocA family oxidoreductase [Spirochaetota bacterium]
MKTTGLGLIGAGRMGNLHTNALANVEGAAISGVYDIKPDVAKAFGEKFGARVYASAEELAHSADIDGVLVCSPTPCHPEGVAAALHANKAIFCEKPLCRNKASAKKLLNAGEALGKPFAVGFVRRYMAKTHELKKRLEAGDIGTPRFCNIDLPLGMYKRMPGDWFADFDACGGVILDMLAHHIDLANWFFGKPVRVYAASLLLDAKQPEPADYAACVVTYENGLICNFMASWWRSGRTGEMMEISGDGGSLIMDGTDDLTYWQKGREKQSIHTQGENAHKAQMECFVNSIRGTTAPTATLRDGYNSLVTALAMIESAKTGKAMRL